MIKRPISVTIISALLIIGGILSILSFIMISRNPAAQGMMAKSMLPVSIQYIMLGISIVISFSCGTGMLYRQAWARIVYVIWPCISLTIALIATPNKTAVIPGVVVFAIVVFFLFRPDANEYFAKK